MIKKSPFGQTSFPMKSFKDDCTFLSGYAFSSNDMGDSGYPVIKIKNIKNRRVSVDGSQFVDGSTITSKLDKYKLENLDILIAMTGQGSVGRVGRLDLDSDITAYLNQRVGKFIPNEINLNADFLYYILSSEQYERVLFSAGSGSGQPNLSPTIIQSIEIPYPPYKLQCEIGKFLRLLDDKIKNNHLMNQTLEEMVRSIFKSWFVDFDPVHAKADGNVPTHMDAETAALFPSSFGDDGLPVGWKVLDIGSVVEIRKGLSYKGKFLSETGTNMINLGCFGFRGKFKPEKIKFYSGDYKDRHKIKPGDLIFANTDMTQDRAILCSPVIVPSYINEDETIFSHHVSHVHFLETQHPAFIEFLRHCMMTQNFRMRAEGYATGTTVLAVPKNIFNGYYVPIPSDKILNVFFEFISGISKKLEVNYIENKTLSELRDTLLPKLMSGEIHVKDPEREVEAAV